MKRLLAVLTVLALSLPGLVSAAQIETSAAIGSAMPVAQQAPASDATIQTYFAVAHVAASVDKIRQMAMPIMSKEIGNSLGGRQPTLKQQLAISHFEQTVNAIFDAQLNWARLEPLYVQIFRQTFSEGELQGIIRFLQTPEGRAWVDKMPRVAQLSMLQSMLLVKAMQPQLLKASLQFRADMIDAKP